MARQTIKREFPLFSGDSLKRPFLLLSMRTVLTYKFSIYENINRLRRALTGRAKERVQSLLLVPQNVNDIIDILRNRFGH